MNGKVIILFLAIVSVGGMGITSPAFADQSIPQRYLDDIDPNQLPPAITFSIESDTYDHDSIIVITGQVKTVKDVPIIVVVSGPIILVPHKPLPDGTYIDQTDVYQPMNVVQIAQVKISSDGSFSTTVNTANPMMKYDGLYKIEATYDQFVNHFEHINLVGGIEAGSLAGHEEHHEAEVVDLANEVDYSISGGNVDSVAANVNGNSLVVSIHDAEDGGELTITLPSDVITPFNDGTFFVLVNDEESDDASQDGNTITVPFDADATTIEIIGTHVVPEFGTIAAIILAVAITSIIVISTRSKLNLVPKL
jgi:predicted secreted protein with PEFG-CTERM motif